LADDDRAKITIDSEINNDGIDKGLADLNKKTGEYAGKSQKELEKAEGAFEGVGKAAGEAAKEVEDAAARQIAAIKSGEREKLEAVRAGEAALVAEARKAADEKIALLEREKSGLTESAYNDRLEAIRREEQAKTSEIKRGAAEREALVKKEADRQVKAVRDSEKKQLEEIKKGARSKLNEIKEFGDKANQSLSKLASFLSTGGLSALGLGVAAAGIKQAASALGEWGREAVQQEMATGRLEAVLKSTGASAWVSSTQLQKMANEQRNATGKSRDEIAEMQAVLLGFRSVTRDVFGDATQAVLDMSAVMGGGLVSTANSLGKALDSPVEGMGALSRQGFVFTAQQKELVKVLEETGRHEEAQRVILKEVQLAFDGASTATGDAVRSQMRYNNAIEDLKKNIGAGWQEATAPARDWLTEIIVKYNEAIAKRKELDGLGKDITANFNEELGKDEKASRDFINVLKTEYLEAFQGIENFAMVTEDTEERRKQLQQELLRLYRQINEEKGYELSFITEAVSAYGNFIPQVKEASREIQKEREAIDAIRKSEIERGEFIKAADAKAKTAWAEELAARQAIADKREESRKALEQEIALITKKAKLEGKNIQSEEIQKQILNARVSAYTALVKEIGDAGEEEKRAFGELRAEYARLEIEAAARLQEDNLKNLERQKQAVLEKAELEGRAAGSLETQKELLDAEAQAYGKQLEILRELIDGAGEEESGRRRALQASWDQYRAEQMTAEAQKKRLADLAEAQKNFISSASSLYQGTVKDARDSENQRESGRLLEEEKKAAEGYQKWFAPFWTEAQRQKKDAAVNAINSTAEHEKKMAEQAAQDKLVSIQKEWEELQENEAKQAEWIADRKREAEEKYQQAVAEIRRRSARELEAYTVETGDSLGVIAQKYGTTVEGILALNKEITNRNIIKPGQIIKIPGSGMAPEEETRAMLQAEEERARGLLNLEGETNAALEQAEREFADAKALIYQETADKITAIEEDASKKIKKMDKEKWDNLRKNVSDYLDTFRQAANSIFSIWNSVISAELEAKLRENDEIIQSDEEREKREKELRREAAMEKYKADLAQYAVNIIMANGQAALGVLTALAQSGIPGAIAAGVLGALNVALVAAAKPQPPRFHEGGIAQGAPGQDIPAVLKAGETVLTPSQFQNTMAAIARLAHGDSGSGGVSLSVDVKNYSPHARVEKPVFDRGVLHMIIREEVNGMYGSGELDKGIARKEYRDRGIVLE
jgi:LysM repeat protein